jgi:hypothetical protein
MKKSYDLSQVLGAYTYNPSFLKDWDQEDRGSRPAQAEQFARPHLNGKKLKAYSSRIVVQDSLGKKYDPF